MHSRIGSTTAVAVAAAVAIAVIIGGIATGCSRSSDASVTPETTTGSTPDTTEVADTTSTSVLTDEEAIVATYQGFWDAWLAANDPPDPNYPGLSRYYGGKALETAIAAIEQAQALGTVIRLPENSSFGFTVENLNISGLSATMDVCLVDDAQIFDGASGHLADDSVTSSRIDVLLSLELGRWVVIENNFVSTVSGAGGCEN